MEGGSCAVKWRIGLERKRKREGSKYKGGLRRVEVLDSASKNIFSSIFLI
jgi:hypothetical protein